MDKQKSPDYKKLREIIEKEIGKEYTDQLSDEDIEAFGNFLIDATHEVRHQGIF